MSAQRTTCGFDRQQVAYRHRSALLKCSLKGPPAQPVHIILPMRKNSDEPAGFRGESRASSGLTSAAGEQDRTAERPLHPAEPIEAGTVTPADRFTTLADRAGLVYCSQEAEIIGAHQEQPVPVQPYLVPRRKMPIQLGGWLRT
jgi:hypothetical protein